MKQILFLALSLCCSLPMTAAAQFETCSESRDQYESRSRCERFHTTCEYDSRTRCYSSALDRPNRCDRRSDEYESRSACEADHRQGCVYENGCYVPDRANRCDPRLEQYETRSLCEGLHKQGCYLLGNCYIPDPNRKVCDANFKEYDTQARCERFHTQGCVYESSSGCYVPDKDTPSCPATMPTSVCTSGSREEFGTGWGDVGDCMRKWDETYGRPANLSCYQKSNCCWGLH
jgi:hypothetical protein